MSNLKGPTPPRFQGQGQEGFILHWAVVVLFVAVFTVVPIVTLLGTIFVSEGKIADRTQAYYAAEAGIQAVIEDLVRGADAFPDAPNTYTPPAVAFGELVSSVSIIVREIQTLSTIRAIPYQVTSLNLLQGSNPSGGAANLLADDTSYYEVTGDGDPPKVIWEATSQMLTFEQVSYGDVFMVVSSSKSSTKVEVFVYNPNDPLHTQGGYNPIPDVSEILDAAFNEETVTFSLEDADVQYLNSQATKTLKVKVRATRTGGFKLSADQLTFNIAGATTQDVRYVKGNPTILTGSLASGSGADLDFDDTNYYSLGSTGNVVEFEAESDPFIFTSIDTLSVSYIVRSNQASETVELYVYNPTDPSHTNGGYNPVPDLTTNIPVQNLDKSVSLAVNQTDISYINSLPQEQKTMKVKIRATSNSAFSLFSDRLTFQSTALGGAVTQVLRQITHQYIDPGLRNPAMASLAPKEGYLLRLYKVRPGIMAVNWAYHTPDYSQAKVSVTIFRGFAVMNGVAVTPGKITAKIPSQDNELVLSAVSRPGEGFVRTKFVTMEDGVYSIMLYNDSSNTIITEPFFASGGERDTWIYAPAYKDYLVTSSVGGVQIKAVVRQIPGPSEPPTFPWANSNINWLTNLVGIQSWETLGTGSQP